MKRHTWLPPAQGCMLLAVFLVQARQNITVAAASDLQAVLPEIAARFQRVSGHHVTLTFGSSGNFFSQIQNGAPFDIFFSADVEYPKRIVSTGLAEAGTLSAYATGKIVLWAAIDARIDVRRGLDTLLDPRVRRIAIANPEHAPYGRAAVDALRHGLIYEKVRDKLVTGENVAQAAQFVQSGGADVGIVALSLALGPGLKDHGTYYEIPTSLYRPIEQGVVILKSSRHKDVARQFLSYLETPDIQLLMQTHGFSAPRRTSSQP